MAYQVNFKNKDAGEAANDILNQLGSSELDDVHNLNNEMVHALGHPPTAQEAYKYLVDKFDHAAPSEDGDVSSDAVTAQRLMAYYSFKDRIAGLKAKGQTFTDVPDLTSDALVQVTKDARNVRLGALDPLEKALAQSIPDDISQRDRVRDIIKQAQGDPDEVRVALNNAAEDGRSLSWITSTTADNRKALEVYNAWQDGVTKQKQQDAAKQQATDAAALVTRQQAQTQSTVDHMLSLSVEDQIKSGDALVATDKPRAYLWYRAAGVQAAADGKWDQFDQANGLLKTLNPSADDIKNASEIGSRAGWTKLFAQAGTNLTKAAAVDANDDAKAVLAWSQLTTVPGVAKDDHALDTLSALALKNNARAQEYYGLAAGNKDLVTTPDNKVSAEWLLIAQANGRDEHDALTQLNLQPADWDAVKTAADADIAKFTPVPDGLQAKVDALADAAKAGNLPAAAAPVVPASPAAAPGGAAGGKVKLGSQEYDSIEPEIQLQLEAEGFSTGGKNHSAYAEFVKKNGHAPTVADLTSGAFHLDGANGPATKKAITDFKAKHKDHTFTSADEALSDDDKTFIKSLLVASQGQSQTVDATAITADIAPLAADLTDTSVVADGKLVNTPANLTKVEGQLEKIVTDLNGQAIPDSVKDAVKDALTKLDKVVVAGIDPATISSGLSALAKLKTAAGIQ